MTSQEIATTEQQTKPRPKRRISAKVRQLIDVLASGRARTQTQAAQLVSLTPESVCRALKRQDVRFELEKALQNNVDRAKLKASVVLNDLLDNGKSEHVKAKLTEYCLGLAGHVVAQNAAPLVQNNIRITRTIINGIEHEILNGYYVNLDPAEFFPPHHLITQTLARTLSRCPRPYPQPARGQNDNALFAGWAGN